MYWMYIHIFLIVFWFQVRSQHQERTVEFIVDELGLMTRKEANERVFFISAKEVSLLLVTRDWLQPIYKCKEVIVTCDYFQPLSECKSNLPVIEDATKG